MSTMANDYVQKQSIRNLEFLVRKHKEDFDSEISSNKQDALIRLKNIQDELTNRIDSKEVFLVGVNDMKFLKRKGRIK